MLLGYRRIINSCRSGGYPEPEWIELGSVVRVVFYSHPEASEELIDMVTTPCPEFLSFQSIDPKDLYSTKNRAKIQISFNEYLTWGGYPELVEHKEKI